MASEEDLVIEPSLDFITMHDRGYVKTISSSLCAIFLPSGLNFSNVLCTAFTLADPKSIKKDCQVVNLFYAFGIYERKMLLKLMAGVNVTKLLIGSSYVCRSQKHKKTVKSSVSFCAFGIFTRKSCV